MKFKLHWIGGETEEVEGPTIARAMSRAGYGAGTVRALDYYETVTQNPMDEAGIQMKCLYCGAETTLRLNAGNLDRVTPEGKNPIGIEILPQKLDYCRIECSGCGYVVIIE